MKQREFTGRHMAIITFSFFGVVIAVNLLMATLATRTFGGTVVDNSYVASQRFNGWLREARQQSALQWSSTTSLDREGRLLVAMETPSGPLDGASLEANASHPLGRQPERRLSLEPRGEGQFRSSDPLPRGRWIIRLSVRRDGQEARYLAEVRR